MNSDSSQNPDELLPARRSLLKRLCNFDDQPSWRELMDTCWKFIYGTGFRITWWQRFALALAAVVLLCAGYSWLVHEGQLAQERALYQGRTVREWVNAALADEGQRTDSDAIRMVVQIGQPAVPYLISALDSLRENPVHFRLRCWQNQWLPTWCHLLEERYDVSGRAVDATHLLTAMGGAVARPAIPAIIRSVEEVHYWAYLDILDDLAMLGPAASSAVPWLKQLAEKGDASAAYTLSLIAPDDDTLTRVVVRLIQVQKTPSGASRELYWLRDETRLNLKIVPLLAELLCDVSADGKERACAADQLGYRGREALPLLPLMQTTAAQADSLELRKSITNAIAMILAAKPAPAATSGVRGAVADAPE